MADGEKNPDTPGRRSWTGIASISAAVIAAVGSLIGGLAAAGLLGGSSGTANNAAQASPKLLTGPNTVTLEFPANSSEQRLASFIPQDIRVDCERGTDAIAVGIATLTCAEPATRVTYSLFSSPAEATKYIHSRRGFGNAEHNCGEASSGAGTYYQEHNGNRRYVGTLICYLRDGSAWIEWTNTDDAVYAYAFRNDKNWKALFNSWRALGPDPERT